MRIIPAIDIIDGKCVRLTKGDYSTSKIYNEDPLEVARQFEDSGIRFLHLVDLDGARSKHVVNYKVLNDIARNTGLSIDFSGGIKSDDDLKIAFDNGANQVSIGSIALENKPLFLRWLHDFGNEKIILSADAMDRKIASHGWLEQSSIDVMDFIAGFEKQNLKYVICTDISKDGMLQGTSEELYKEIIAASPIRLIASGGVSSMDDLMRLDSIGCDGAIIGKALYENRITLKQIQDLC